MDLRRISLIPRPLAVRRAWQLKRKRAIKAIVLLFPTAVLSMAPVSASQATGSEPGVNFPLTSLTTPLHAAISSDAAVLLSRLAALAANPPPLPPPASVVAAPVATAPAAPPDVDVSSAAAWAASPGVVCIRERESDGNYAEDSGNGYYGAYQDLLSTWEANGGTGLPSGAPPAIQDQINYEIFLSGGWGQWSTAPGCGL